MKKWRNSVSAKAGTLWKGKQGELLWEPLLILTIVIILLLNGMNLFNMLLTYQRVNYIAKAVTKTIELEGQVNSDVWTQLDELNKGMETHAELSVSNVRYFNASQKTIQFRDPFTVTLKDTYKYTILTPAFSNPVVLNIPISCTLTGMSEVYWKR